MEKERKRKNITLSIDSEVQLEFKMENVRNSSDMSTTVENFMRHYVETSKKLHHERMLKNLQTPNLEKHGG